MALTLSDEVSTPSFRVDNETDISDDTRFWNLRLPWSHGFPVRHGPDSLRLSATAGLLSADDHVFILKRSCKRYSGAPVLQELLHDGSVGEWSDEHAWRARSDRSLRRR